MSEKTITVIPKKPDIPIDLVTGKIRKKKVCGYARVSTDFEDQKNSFDFQKREFEERIKQNSEWEFVGMYSDEGISGTNTIHREGFRNMIKDAEHGKIDLILIKSLSRFARNTVDCLNNIRKLANLGVSVYFEKENITTTKDNVDLVLTIHAAIAEAESRDISESVKWGFQKRMQKGEKKTPVGKTIGYSSDAEGKWYINEEKELITTIFDMFVNGFTINDIVERLKRTDKQSGRKWQYNKVFRILRNERYKGTIIHQKTVTVDVLTHKRIKNDGLEPIYIVDNHHDSIIDPDVFDYVQMVLDSQKSKRFGDSIIKSNQTPLSGLIVCEECGRTLRRVKYPYNNEYVLTCKNRNKNDEHYCDCTSEVIPYDLVESAVIDVLNKFNTYKNDTCSDLINHLLNRMEETDFITKYKELQQERMEKEQEINILIKDQTQIAETSSSFNAHFLGLKEQIKIIDSEMAKLKALAKESHDLKGKRGEIQDILTGYKSTNISLIRNFVPFIIHKKDGSLRFVLSPENSKNMSYRRIREKVLTAAPIYESMVNNKNYSLSFDVITYKEEKTCQN